MYEDDDGPLKMCKNWNKISFLTSLDNFITFCWIAEDDLMINLQVLTYSYISEFIFNVL